LLAQQAALTGKTAALGLQIFVANTDVDTAEGDFLGFLSDLTSRLNKKAGAGGGGGSFDEATCNVQLIYDPYARPRSQPNTIYGYDATDMLLR